MPAPRLSGKASNDKSVFDINVAASTKICGMIHNPKKGSVGVRGLWVRVESRMVAPVQLVDVKFVERVNLLIGKSLDCRFSR